MLPLIEIEKEKRRRELENRRNYLAEIENYKKNPLDYFSDKLGIKPETIDWNLIKGYENHKWDGSVNPFMEIINSLVKNNWVGVESATGTGKTFLGALLVFWFLECFEHSLVVTTAPKQEQLSLHIWKEICRLHPSFGKGELTQLKLKLNVDDDERMAVGFVAGVKADEESSTRAQGFHAEHMLIILEETPGIPAPVITALQNTCTAPHNIIIAFGNPDSTMDNLHTFCLQKQVKQFRISAFDHPNVVLNNSGFIPGAASREGIRRIEERFGKDCAIALSRTRGISPDQPKYALIRMEWIKKAIELFNDKCLPNGKIPEEKLTGLFALGVDVADSEQGDKAAIAIGRGEYLISVSEFQCSDSNRLGKKDIFLLMNEKGILPDNVGVDGIGVGAGTINALKEIGVKVINIKGSESPVKLNLSEDFNNLRSQMWWQLREDLRTGKIGIPNDSVLIADLITPIWCIKNGNIVVESKEEIKKRLGRSPNRGDSVVYWNWVRTERKRKAKVNTSIL